MSRASISMESWDFFVRQKREVKEPMDCFDSPIQFSREIALRKLLPPAAARLLRVRLKLWLGNCWMLQNSCAWRCTPEN